MYYEKGMVNGREAIAFWPESPESYRPNMNWQGMPDMVLRTKVRPRDGMTLVDIQGLTPLLHWTSRVSNERPLTDLAMKCIDRGWCVSLKIDTIYVRSNGEMCLIVLPFAEPSLGDVETLRDYLKNPDEFGAFASANDFDGFISRKSSSSRKLEKGFFNFDGADSDFKDDAHKEAQKEAVDFFGTDFSLPDSDEVDGRESSDAVQKPSEVADSNGVPETDDGGIGDFSFPGFGFGMDTVPEEEPVETKVHGLERATDRESDVKINATDSETGRWHEEYNNFPLHSVASVEEEAVPEKTVPGQHEPAAVRDQYEDEKRETVSDHQPSVEEQIIDPDRGSENVVEAFKRFSKAFRESTVYKNYERNNDSEQPKIVNSVNVAETLSASSFAATEKAVLRTAEVTREAEAEVEVGDQTTSSADRSSTLVGAGDEIFEAYPTKAADTLDTQKQIDEKDEADDFFDGIDEIFEVYPTSEDKGMAQTGELVADQENITGKASSVQVETKPELSPPADDLGLGLPDDFGGSWFEEPSMPKNEEKPKRTPPVPEPAMTDPLPVNSADEGSAEADDSFLDAMQFFDDLLNQQDDGI